MLLEIFKDSFEYSYKDFISIFKLGFLSLLSVFFIPTFFVLGYYYRVVDVGLNGTINGEDPLPKFGNWFEMFIQGIKILFVRFIYFIPGILVLIVGNLILVATHPALFNNMIINNMPFSSNLSLLSFEIGIIIISSILWLTFYLFSTVAITNMVNEKSFLAAFNFKDIIKIIQSIGFVRYVKFYFGCLILFIGIFGVVSLVISLISGAMSFLTWVITNSATYSAIVGGPIAGVLAMVVILFLIPFCMIFESRAIALIYNMRELD